MVLLLAYACAQATAGRVAVLRACRRVWGGDGQVVGGVISKDTESYPMDIGRF